MAEFGTTVLRPDVSALDTLTRHLPVWNVLPPVALQLRCVSSRGDVIVFGTHLDVVLVFYRDNGELQKVSLEDGFKLFASKHQEGISTTCFSPVLPSGQSRVAIGRSCGKVHVIQFSNKDAERKSTQLGSIHKEEVTSLDWDTRGMMLFSADTSGRVFASHLDMKGGEHNSWQVYDARQSVVQISYSNMQLLVVTADSCTLCHIHQNVFKKKPAKINQGRPQPLACRGGIMLKDGDRTACFLSCQTLNFLEASAEGEVTRITPLFHQVECGTFDKVTLPAGHMPESPLAARAFEEGLEFGRVLTTGPYLVTWCSSHVWLIQPSPAITVIASCTAESPSEFVDVCVDGTAIFVLRKQCGKACPVLRLAVGQSAGSSSPSRSRSSSKHISDVADVHVATSEKVPDLSTPTTTHGPEPKDSPGTPTSYTAGAAATAATVTVADVSAERNAETTGHMLQNSMTDFTDRFKNLVSKGLGSTAVSPGVPVESEQMDERLAAVIRSDRDAAMASGQHVPPANVAAAADSLAAQEPAAQSDQQQQAQVGWLDKLRNRGHVPPSLEHSGSGKTPSPSPAMPAPESREFIKQWMSDQPPSLANDDEDSLVVAAPVQKKKKKKKKVVKRDAGTAQSLGDVSPSMAAMAVGGRDRSDSAVSADGGGGSDCCTAGAFHTGDIVASANAMLVATQEALQRSTSVPSSAQPALSTDAAAGAPVDVTAGLPSTVGSTGGNDDVPAALGHAATANSNNSTGIPAPVRSSTPVSPAPGARVQSVGETTEAVSTLDQRPTGPATLDLGVAEISSLPTTTPSPLQVSPVKVPSARTSTGAGTPTAAALVYDVSSADDLASSADHDLNASAMSVGGADAAAATSQDELDGGDLVHQSYDASLPAHLLGQTHASDDAGEEATTGAAAAAPSQSQLAAPTRRYDPGFGRDSASKLSCPSRRHLTCLAMSRKHIWISDSGDYIYNWSNDTLAWTYVKGAYAAKLAASQSSDVVWALSRQGIVAARAGMSSAAPLGTSWLKLGKLRMKCIAIDADTAWLVTRDGQLLRRRNLVAENPLGEKWHEEGTSSLTNSIVQLAAGNGVLWALTTHAALLVRAGISDANPLGTCWEEVDNKLRASCIAIGQNGYCWCVSSDGIACFMPDVTLDSPSVTDKQWWQVSLGLQLMRDTSLLSSIKDASARVTSLWSSKHSDPDQSVKLVSCSNLGVGVITSSSVLLYSSSDMLGMVYLPPSIASLAETTIWLLVDASTAFKSKGLVWLLSPTGEIFSLPRDGRPHPVPIPDGCSVQRLSASHHGVFGLTSDGTLYMRTGVTDYCLAGLSWEVVQPPSAAAATVAMSCGNTVTWLVDAKGQAWVQSCTPTGTFHEDWACIGPPPHSKLVQVVVGPGDWHVWACDSSGNVYARTGISISAPAGKSWEAAPNVDATDISISANAVWARCANGDIVLRVNVSPSNPVGDYWRRIPGNFATVSATPDDDELWLLDDDGRLFVRNTRVYTAVVQPEENEQLVESWELVPKS